MIFFVKQNKINKKKKFFAYYLFKTNTQLLYHLIHLKRISKKIKFIFFKFKNKKKIFRLVKQPNYLTHTKINSYLFSVKIQKTNLVFSKLIYIQFSFLD